MKTIGVFGLAFGAAVIMRIDPTVLKRVAGGIILLVLVVMLVRPRLGEEAGPPRASRLAVGVWAIPMGSTKGCSVQATAWWRAFFSVSGGATI